MLVVGLLVLPVKRCSLFLTSRGLFFCLPFTKKLSEDVLFSLMLLAASSLARGFHLVVAHHVTESLAIDGCKGEDLVIFQTKIGRTQIVNKMEFI